MGLRVLNSLANFRRLAGGLLEFCYPNHCAVCHAPCNTEKPLCDACMGEFSTLTAAPACARCAKPVARENAPCPWCMGKGMYPYDRVARLGEHAEPIRDLVLQLKYNGRWGLGEMLADELRRRPAAAQIMRQAQCIMPVPLYFWRHIQRGYNQAEVIARHLARTTDAKLAHAVKRIRATESQTRLSSQTARHENVKGAFRLVNAQAVAGKHVVVVDDVTTTGATLKEVGRMILPAKPASLCAIVVSIADPHRRNFQAI